MLFKRAIYDKVSAEITSPKILVITGIRHVGKTTLLNQLYEKVVSQNKTILDFENPFHRKIFEEENYDNIWNNLAQFGISKNRKSYIFIDEFQNLPVASHSVKYLFDHYQVKFFLTGSSSYYLKNLFPESLANRKFVFELHPLTFAEFLVFREITRISYDNWSEKAKNKNYIAHQKLIAYYKEYMQFGGFPEVVLEENQNRKKELLKEIFTSYFEKDVKTLATFKDLSKIRDLILILASRVGSKIDVAKLASELSLSRETIYNYLEFLQRSYLLRLIPKHTGSVDRRVAGGKKAYICDTGLANFLAQISLGQLMENSIFQNLYPNFDDIAYFDKEGRLEIDFIISSKIGLEAKTSVSPKEIDFFLRRIASAKLAEGYVVSLQFNSHNKVILSTDL